MQQKLGTISKGQPLCQFPREDYNRIVEILNFLKGGKGISILQNGDKWTISIDTKWLEGKIEAETSQAMDSVANEAEGNRDNVELPWAYLSLNEGSGRTANAQTWNRGDKTGEKFYAPFLNVYSRFYWDSSNHQLMAFRRTIFFDADGNAKSIGAESGEALFTTSPENF